MLKIVEIFQQKGTDHVTLLIVFCAIYSFLIWVSETIEIFFFKIRLDMLMFKIDESFQEKDTDHKMLLIVSCSICLFLFESLKLIIQFRTRFEQIAGYSELLKYLISFQKFLSSSKCFLFHVNVSFFFYLAPTKPILAVAQIGWNIAPKF